MTTIILLPTAAGNYQQFTNGAGTVPTNVQTADGNTSFRTTTTDGQKDTFPVDDMPGNIASVSQADASISAATTSGTMTGRNMMRSSVPTDRFGANKTITTTYSEHNEVWATDADSSAWDETKINAHEFGYESVSGSASAMRVSRVMVTVTYEIGAGGYNWLIGCWLPPLIAVASHVLTRREILAALDCLKYKRISLPSNNEDFAAIMAAFRVRPVYA